MQPKVGFSLVIYIGSYFPLSLIIFLQNLEYKSFESDSDLNLKVLLCNLIDVLGELSFPLVIFLLSMSCFIFSYLILRFFPIKRVIKIEKSKYIPSELMNYVLPYVVTFMNLDYSETNRIIGFVVFMAWIFWITHKSGNIILNPILVVLGWRLYEVVYSHDGSPKKQQGRILSQVKVEVDGRYKANHFQDVLISRETGGGKDYDSAG